MATATARFKVLHCGQMKRFLNGSSCNGNTNLKEMLNKSCRRKILDVNVISNQRKSVLRQMHSCGSISQTNFRTVFGIARWCSTLSQESSQSTTQGSITTEEPFTLVKSDFTNFFGDIKKALHTGCEELQNLATYHFDGHGKSFRPMVVMLMAKACNHHVQDSASQESVISQSQRQIAMISEMIHTASLIHDDVIDASAMRRGKPSVQHQWGQRKAILCADYILSMSSIMLARIGDEEVVEVLSQVLEDLVRGEFMQLGSRENENERFAHYLKKTFKKTASLIANACKAVAILSECSEDMVDIAFQYGRNIGIAFQLVDDLLDFTSCEAMMGKPTTADLKLGLATAPVLFAAQEHPDLNPLIMRRFGKPGDVEKARKLVEKSDGIRQTKFLAEQHCRQAVRVVQRLRQSAERDALVTVTNKVLDRLK